MRSRWRPCSCCGSCRPSGGSASMFSHHGGTGRRERHPPAAGTVTWRDAIVPRARDHGRQADYAAWRARRSPSRPARETSSPTSPASAAGSPPRAAVTGCCTSSSRTRRSASRCSSCTPGSDDDLLAALRRPAAGRRPLAARPRLARSRALARPAGAGSAVRDAAGDRRRDRARHLAVGGAGRPQRRQPRAHRTAEPVRSRG